MHALHVILDVGSKSLVFGYFSALDPEILVGGRPGEEGGLGGVLAGLAVGIDAFLEILKSLGLGTGFHPSCYCTDNFE